MTSTSDEKWRLFNYFFSRVELRTYQHLCRVTLEEFKNRLRKLYRLYRVLPGVILEKVN